MRLPYWDRKNGSVRAVKRMAAEFRRMRAARDAGDDLLCATTRDRLTAGYVDSLHGYALRVRRGCLRKFGRGVFEYGAYGWRSDITCHTAAAAL
jgi:hypothetical protein